MGQNQIRQSSSLSNPRRPDIQGLRAVAVLAVIAHHGQIPIPGGFAGVDIFFVISGYVITSSLLREISRSGRISIGGFFHRRIWRLGPALAAVVLVVSTASIFFFSPGGAAQTAIGTGLAALILGANLFAAASTGDYFSPDATTNPMLHTWSLSVEEQFYLVFPFVFLFFFFVFRSRPRERLFWGLLLASGISFAIANLSHFGSQLDFWGSWFALGFYSPFTRAWEFGLGAVAAIAADLRWIRPSRSIALLAQHIGLLGLVLSFAILNDGTPYPSMWTLIPTVSTVIVILATPTAKGGFSRILEASALRYVGDRSYSIYLWHWPGAVFLMASFPDLPGAAAIGIGLSFFPAILSFRYLEEKFRGGRHAPNSRPVVAAKIMFGSALLISAVGLLTAQQVSKAIDIDHDADWPSAIAQCDQIRDGVLQEPNGPEKWASDCVWNENATGEPIFLIGDSVAGSYSAPLIEIAQSSNRPLHAFTQQGCRPVFGLQQREICSTYMNTAISELKKHNSATVVLAGTDTHLYDRESMVEEGSGRTFTSVLEKSSFYLTLTRRTVSEFEALGHEVILVQPIPTFRLPPPEWEPRYCSVFDHLFNSCDKTVSLEDFLLNQGAFRAQLHEFARKNSVPLIDFADRYCDETKCSPVVNGKLRYVDATHITLQESQELLPYFEAAFPR